MRTPQIKSFKRIIPMIYAYTTPEIPSHRGWTKIGYTANQTVEERIHQQTAPPTRRSRSGFTSKPTPPM